MSAAAVALLESAPLHSGHSRLCDRGKQDARLHQTLPNALRDLSSLPLGTASRPAQCVARRSALTRTIGHGIPGCPQPSPISSFSHRPTRWKTAFFSAEAIGVGTAPVYQQPGDGAGRGKGSGSAAMAEGSRRFPPPWRADKTPHGYVVRDANGQAIAYIYSRENEAEARRFGRQFRM